MAGEPIITVIGNLAGDPELRFTASGHAVANLTIAQTPRTRNQQSGEWVDDETLWVRGTVWREYAENVAETLTKGMHVIAIGRLQARSFEDKQGNQRTNWELQIDEIGPSLRWSTAQVQRTQRSNNGSGGFDQGNGGFGQPPSGPQYSGGFSQPPAGQPGNQFGQPSNYAQQPPQQGGNVWNPPPGQGNPGWDNHQGAPPPF